MLKLKEKNKSELSEAEKYFLAGVDAEDTAFINASNYNIAIQNFEKSLKLEPSPLKYYYLIGAVALNSEPKKVESYCKEAIEMYPDYIPIYLQLFNYYQGMGRTGEAKELFERVKEKMAVEKWTKRKR
jgi:tetratricopeptide (TPR) repeat protein